MKTYQDNALRSRNVIITFCILAIINILSIVLELFQNSVLRGYELGDYSSSDVEQLDSLVAILALAQVITIIIVIVLFILWYRRAYENLIRLNIRTQYSANGAVWGFFIPFVNWVRPISTMKEIFMKSQRKLKEHNEAYVIDDNESFIVAWWILYIVNGLIGRYASKAIERADTIDAFIEANLVYVFSDCVSLLSIGLALYVVHKISQVETKLNVTDTSTTLIDMIGVPDAE